MNKSDIDRFRNSLSNDERKRIDDAKNVIYKFVPGIKELDSSGNCGIGLFLVDMNDASRTKYIKVFQKDTNFQQILIIRKENGNE